jgi:hypothetical protein
MDFEQFRRLPIKDAFDAAGIAYRGLLKTEKMAPAPSWPALIVARILLWLSGQCEHVALRLLTGTRT